MGISLDRQTAVFIDTAPFIYFFEEHAAFANTIGGFFKAIEDRGGHLFTSLVTYMEILTRPLAEGDTRLVDKYRAFFTNSENLALTPFTPAVAEAAAALRATTGLKTPDAIQLASARSCGADYVLTNDQAWNRVPGFTILTPEDLAAFG